MGKRNILFLSCGVAIELLHSHYDFILQAEVTSTLSMASADFHGGNPGVNHLHVGPREEA